MIRTCRMDKDGFFNFSAANLWHRAVIERAKCVIVEVTDGLPYCLGHENGVHVSEVDYIIEGDNQPAPVVPNPPATEVDRAVGRLIAAEIEDGALPPDRDRRDAERGLYRAAPQRGARSGRAYRDDDRRDRGPLQGRRVNGARKQTHPGKLTYSFALGSSDLYALCTRTPISPACRSITPTCRTTS